MNEERDLRATLDMWENMEEEQRLKQLKFLINEGFQKGKLEQKKEDILEHLEFFKDLLFSYNSRWFKEKIEKRIKQLQKEIVGNEK